MAAVAALAALAIAGSLASAAGHAVAGIQEQRAREFNAKILDNQAAATRAKAKFDEAIQRDRIRKFLSKQRAAIGRSGVTVEGSPSLALEETVRAGEIDALAIRFNSAVQENRLHNEANLERFRGKTALTSGFLRAGESLLGGLGSLFKARS